VLIAQHPLRERFRSQHMLALYRVGCRNSIVTLLRESRTRG